MTRVSQVGLLVFPKLWQEMKSAQVIKPVTSVRERLRVGLPLEAPPPRSSVAPPQPSPGERLLEQKIGQKFQK